MLGARISCHPYVQKESAAARSAAVVAGSWCVLLNRCEGQRCAHTFICIVFFFSPRNMQSVALWKNVLHFTFPFDDGLSFFCPSSFRCLLHMYVWNSFEEACCSKNSNLVFLAVVVGCGWWQTYWHKIDWKPWWFLCVSPKKKKKRKNTFPV